MRKTSLHKGFNPFSQTKAHKMSIALAEKAAPKSQAANYPDIDFSQGGQWLVDAVRQYGCTESREPIRMNPMIEEALSLIGDFRFSRLYLTGAAQVFKSLIGWQLAAAMLTIGGKRWMWVYADGNQVSKLVPTQFIPIVEEWEKATKLHRKANPKDSKSMEIWQSARGTGRFASANNPSAGKAELEGRATASKGAVSASVDLLVFDETSQTLASAREPFQKRTLQGTIATRPSIEIGTPGRGSGIELGVSEATYDFYAHTQCQNCKEISPLHPLGWLLKNHEEDASKPKNYYDEIGKPYRTAEQAYWHHSDPEDPIESAYFGCPSCGHLIEKDQCLQGSWFQCRKTGVRLKEFLAELPKEYPKRAISAGITLSPLIRDTLNSGGAVNIISEGLKSRVPQDWQQQDLGVASTTATGGITKDMLIRSLNSAIPFQKTTRLDVWGCDLGTKYHYLAQTRYRVAEQRAGKPKLSAQEIYEKSHRSVYFLQAVTENELLDKIKNCDGGAIDVDPFRDFAGEVRKKIKNVVLADQRGRREMAKEIARESEVEIGAKPLPVMLCDTHQLQTYILNLFTGIDDDTGECRIKLPANVDPNNMAAGSPARQLTTSTRDKDLLWSRPIDHDDDLLKAIVFCELWFWCWCHGRLPKTAIDYGAIADKLRER